MWTGCPSITYEVEPHRPVGRTLCAAGLFVKLTGGRVPVLEVCLVRSAISFVLTILLMKSARMQGPIFGQRSNLLLLSIRGANQLSLGIAPTP
jgi:hypothetical protein